MQYRSKAVRRDEEQLRQQFWELAAQRHRFDYQQFHILLARAGFRLNHQQAYRLYRLKGQSVRRRRPLFGTLVVCFAERRASAVP